VLSFLNELKRRNVFRVAAAYIVVAWLIIQVAETLFPLFGYDETPARIVVIVLAIGFIPALVLSWAFELTAEGLKRTHEADLAQSITPATGKKLDRIIVVVLALALGYFAFDKFVLDPQRDTALEEQKAVEVEQARLQGRSEALVESYGDQSIAVLAFEDMSPDKDQEYLSDGIAEELLNLLAKISELRVISRSSAFSFKGQNLEIPEIARRLNVAHVLEGSVRKAGDRVRITAQLIEARSDTHLWSETYDRTLDDIFAIQDEIAAKVVDQLKITLLGEAPALAETDPELYTLFLQGRHLRRQNSADSLAQSPELLERVVAADPDYVPALDDLITVYINQVHTDGRDFDEGYRLARELTLKGLERNPEVGRLYAQLGWIEMYYNGDLQAAASSFERGLKLAPDDPSLLADTETLLFLLGRLEDAEKLSSFVLEKDPLHPVAWYNRGQFLAAAHQWEESVAALQTALRLSPELGDGHYFLALALLGSGDPKSALEEIGREPDLQRQLLGKAMIYPALGREDQADAALAEVIESGEMPLSIAEVFAMRGMNDEAFAWIGKAAASGSFEVAEIHVNPRLGNLWTDPRWAQLLQRLGKSPAQLDAVRFEVALPDR
jgi:TolB-like protein